MRPGVNKIEEGYRELGERLSRGATQGPFLFCDYWASVLGLGRVINRKVLDRGLVSLDLFRQALDRPKTRLPKLRYYILAFVLGPGFLPYRLAVNLALLFKPKSREKIVGQADLLLEDFRLRLDPSKEDPRWVRARVGPEETEERILNPDYVRVENGIFFPTYKILMAAIITVLFSLVIIPTLREVNALEWLLPYFGVLFYPVLVAVLQLVMRDFLTALLAPLPVFGVKSLLGITESMWGFVLGMVGAGFLFYFVEWFFIPRGLPPSLYLYVNRPGDALYPYSDRQAPYWLEGRYYWVWRFVSLAPAEIHRFWEKDWERVEIWVRADEGPDAGKVEWVVSDVHFRELWFSYRRVVPDRVRRRHEDKRRRVLQDQKNPLVWVVETDMHFITHTPSIRGVFLTTPEPPLRDRTLFRIIRTLFGPRVTDDYREFEPEIERLEVEMGEILNDVADHFRGVTLRLLFRLPWSFWRYPKGVCSSPRLFLYGDRLPVSQEDAVAADPRYQIKALRQIDILPRDLWETEAVEGPGVIEDGAGEPARDHAGTPGTPPLRP